MSEENLPEFGKMDYWDEGYKTGDAPQEWFVPYSLIRKFVVKHLKPESKTLVIGCGTSSLSAEMYEEGYTTMESMDYSPEAINEMKEKHPNMIWHVMDVRNMPYKDGEFDSIVDKGTLDCLFFLDETNGEIKKMLLEVSRILKPGGQYVVVTCGHPMQRADVFMGDKKYDWTIIDWKEYEKPDESFTHPSAFIYCMKKNIHE